MDGSPSTVTTSATAPPDIVASQLVSAQQPNYGPPTSGYAIASLVLGILGVLIIAILIASGGGSGHTEAPVDQ